MALQSDLSHSPYYDDFNSNNNFYRVLYRPGTAVQTRELNQMQSILQDQIDKFGRHIFTEGSVVEGCSFTFDKNYNYVKINDNYTNNFAISSITDFNDKYVYNENGLKAYIVNVAPGYQSQDPDLNTIFVKYINVGNFANGDNQTKFANGEILSIVSLANPANSSTADTIYSTSIPIGNVVVGTVNNSVGQGYAFSTTPGVIFQKGAFISVPQQTLIVSKYSNAPDNISVGFDSIESIVTPEADSSLLDNAAGAPNYAAPGAHRLKIVPTLYTLTTTETANNDPFFSLVDFKNGVPVSIRNTPAYNILGKQLAKTTYETSGNFIVNPFLLSTEIKADTDSLHLDYVNLISSRGLGYVEGYRVEFLNNNKTSLKKAINTEVVKNQIVSANYGNYVLIDQYIGDFNTENLIEVELHKGVSGTLPNPSDPTSTIPATLGMMAVSSKNFLNAGYSASRKIGKAYVKTIMYDSGRIGSGTDQYRLYLFNIAMDPGQSFADVRSVVRFESSMILGVGDLVLTYTPSVQKFTSSLIKPMLDTMIFPLGQSAIKNVTNMQFVYRNQDASSVAEIKTSGRMSLTLPETTGSGSVVETFNVGTGALSAAEIRNILVIPQSTQYTSYKSGSDLSACGTIVTCPSGQFAFEYGIGDYITFNGETHYITFISNNTQLTIRDPAGAGVSGKSHQKVYVKGVPIDFTRGNRSVTLDGSTLTFDLAEVVPSNNPLVGALRTTVYYDVLRAGEKPIKKVMNRNVYIKIDCSNNSANSTGPWSLGFPDVWKINSIYLNKGSQYDEPGTGTDVVNDFTYSYGRSDNLYGMSFLRPKGLNSAITANSTILVSMDVFTQDRSEGVSFFNANSYPIDDANTANTSAITTQEIPIYTSTSGISYDLRDSLDFRKYVTRTATVTSDYTAATINPDDSKIIDILGTGSYLPSVDTNWQGDVEHYLPRKDLAVLDTKGRFKIIEGIPSMLPKTPNKTPGTMALGTVSIPPYPSLTPSQAADITNGNGIAPVPRYDYAITTTITQNKRYTMADIGTLSTRIDNLEYYTSLNLLEQSTSSLLVKNSTTGLNRFQNGMLVDPFAGHDIGNTLDPNYNIAIDPVKKEMRPAFYQRSEIFKLDPESVNVKQTGALISLNYTEKKYISQSFASKYRNCIEGNIYIFKTNVTLKPNYQTTPDLTTNPDVVNNLDLSQNFINLKNAWGTQWGNWQTVSSDTTVSVGNKSETSSTTDNVGNVHKSYSQRTVTNTSTVQQQTGTQLTITGYNDTKMNLGTFVQDVSIQPYISSSTICFSALGLRPGAKIYAYFNNIAVSSWCFPTNELFERVNPQSGQASAYGDQLVVNADGSIFGVFTIPPKQFQATELEFMLCDAPNLATGAAAITTQGTGTFYATNLSIAKGTSYLNTRVPILDYTEVTQQQTISTSTATNNNTNEVIAGPPLPAPPAPIVNNWNLNYITQENAYYQNINNSYNYSDYVSSNDGGVYYGTGSWSDNGGGGWSSDGFSSSMEGDSEE